MISTRIAEGADPVVLCKMTGHDERVMIRHYLRINEEQSAGKATVVTYSNKGDQQQWQTIWEAGSTSKN